MSRNQRTPHIPLPKGWTKRVRPAVRHDFSLAQYAAVYTRGWAPDSTNTRAPPKAALDRANQELLLLREESRIKDTRRAVRHEILEFCARILVTLPGRTARGD